MPFVDSSKHKWCGYCLKVRDKNLTNCNVCGYRLRARSRRMKAEKKEAMIVRIE